MEGFLCLGEVGLLQYVLSALFFWHKTDANPHGSSCHTVFHAGPLGGPQDEETVAAEVAPSCADARTSPP